MVCYGTSMDISILLTCLLKISLSHLVALVSFYTRWNTSESRWFLDVYTGHWKRSVPWNGPTNLPTNCLSVFDHFVKLALKGLKISQCEQDERVNSFSHEFGENLISRTTRTLQIQIIWKIFQETQEVRITLQVKVEGFMNLGLLSQFQKKYMRFKNRIKNRAC